MISRLRWLISRLPASRRSVADLHMQIVTMQNQLNQLQQCANQQYSTLEDNQHKMLQSLVNEIRTNREHASTMFWANYQQENEDALSARKRFFLNLPKATGSMRLIQRGCAALFNEFTQIANQHHLQYWADFGTLLGCVRHRGFIPWDDDVDLGMTREDIDKLLIILREDDALCARYRAVLVYDPYACCRQLRFRYANNSNPCFLDIFFYDYAPKYTVEQQESFVKLRNNLQQTLQSQPYFQDWKKHGYIENGNEHTQDIEQIFQRYQQQAVQQGLIVNKSDATSMVYGLDNVEAENLYAMQYNEVFPTKTTTFENFSVNVPQCAEKILERAYGNIYQLPSDIITHLRHVDCESLHSSHTDDVIEQDIRSNPYVVDCDRLE